ncbi:MAG: hypothetical protein Q9197_001624 [Variospora fuerteventurae]
MSRLGESAFSQPICTALQIALVKLLRSWNVVPAAVIGHSSGEIAAAFCSGAISDVHALRIAYLRGLATSRRVCDGEGGEAMMAVGLSDTNIQDPRNTTLSGTKSQLVALQQKLILDGIFARLLPVNCAYHSKSMTSVGIDYLQLLQSCPSSPAGSMTSTMISSVSGRSISADELRSEEYWVRNLMSPVRFAAALQQLFESISNTNAPAQESSITPDFLVEIGPSATLRTSIRETLADLGKANDIGYGSILVKGSPAVETAMHLAESLHSRGCPVNLLNINCLGQASQPRMLIDLPGYPFDHSHRYWIESRLSKNFRFRQHEHELLGNAVPDWNPLDARWRKILKSSENEWMADHKVNGSILLPAAAFMAMAIEAAKRLIHPDQEVLAYRIQNATFTTAIVLSPDEDGTEVEMRLGQDYGYVEESRQSLRRTFQLFVLAGQEWSECSHGTVILDYQTRAQPPGAEMSVQEKEVGDSFIAKCTTYLHSQHLYPSLRSAGMQYGRTFQTLTSVAVSDRGGEATGVVRPKVREASILHPTMLDGILQLMFPALQGKSELLPSAMLPTRVDNLWISAPGAADTSEELAVQAHAHGLVHGFRHAEFSMLGRALHSGATLISISGLRAVFMTDTPQGYRPHASKNLCYNVDWRPAISHLDNPAISALCRTPVQATQNRPSKDFLRLAAGVFITKALRDERSHQVALKPLWHQKYTAWMHHALAVLHADNPTYSGLRWVDILTRHELQDQILSELKENVSPICPLYVKIGSRLPDILAGRLNALTYLFDDDQLTRFYANHLRDHITSKMSAYVDLSAHQNPNIRIIEVGAGTGGMTKAVLKHLFQEGAPETGTPRFANYTYTDISASFVESFQNIFKGNEHRAVFRTLDDILAKIVPQKASMQPLRGFEGRELGLTMESVGALDSLVFVENVSVEERLGNREVDVQVRASGLLFRDVLIASGLHDDTRFGLEFGGIVIDVGSETGLTCGQRICGWAYGCTKTRVRCTTSAVQSIPEGLSFAEAASIPVAYCTAYHSLLTIARMKRGESVLIHSGAGGTGQAAIQLAKHMNARIFATVGNEEKKAFLSKAYDIPQSNIFSSRSPSFKDQILALTDGHGVDVVLNSLRDEALHASLECLAPFGRFIDLGRKNYATLPMSLLSRSITFATVDLSHTLTNDPDLLGDTLKAVMDLYAKRVFTISQPLRVFGVSHFFILFSSVQGIVGSKFQANYTCGNVYQDALARYRVRNGQKALSLDIGLMKSVGVVAEHEEVSRWLELQGYMGLEEKELHAILEHHCDPSLPMLSELKCQVVTGLHTPAALEAKGLAESPWLQRPFFSHLRQIGVDEMLLHDSTGRAHDGDDTSHVGSGSSVNFIAGLQAAKTMDEACDLVCDALARKLSTSLGVPREDLDVRKPAFEHGADSLSAIGISQWLEREVGSQVSVFEILDRMSVVELSRVAATKSGHLKGLF